MNHTPFHTHAHLAHPGIVHGFFGRAGGVSEGIYASLNCGPGSRDDAAHVAQNRKRVAHALGMAPAQLITLYQIHSPNVVIVHEPWDASAPPQADALVTNTPGLTLGILTADCAPVLFADHDAGVIGAAHAGWKGALSGVVENTIAAMETLGAKRARITAVIGPCIAQASYEVGQEFLARFTPDEQQRFFIPSSRKNHHQFDLPAYVTSTAQAAGLQRIAALAMDTCSDPDRYFSYRRTTLANEPDYGRQISAIGLRT